MTTGGRTLELLQNANRYNAWTFERVRGALGCRVLEIGCGTGTITEFLSDRAMVVGVDVDAENSAAARARFRGRPNIVIRQLDVTTAAAELSSYHFDSALSVNVFEHIEDDLAALRAVHGLLDSGGTLTLLVPAHPALISSFDRAIGHHRRYTKLDLRGKLEAAGFRVERLRLSNPVGALGWLVNNVALRRRTLHGVVLRPPRSDAGRRRSPGGVSDRSLVGRHRQEGVIPAAARRVWPRGGPDMTRLFALAIILVFLAAFAHVFLGDRVLVGGDVLYSYPPWNGRALAHAPTNWLTSDVVREFLPWLRVEQQAISSGRLPLWNPLMLEGKPLMADYISAAFSPFNLIALPFSAVQGYSLGMLAKLWVAGLGTWAFLRMLGARPLAACVGGLLYATCSYMVVWLGWPHSSAASLLPWVFFGVEGYLRRPSLRWAGAVAAAIGLELLAGHPETSIVLGEGLAIYVPIRYLDARPHRRASLAGLAGSMLLGVGLAGIQWISFAAQFSQTTLSSYHPVAGNFHLALSELSSWLAPNLYGNPGIDGLAGRAPHYNASTGFIGVGGVVLALVGGVARFKPARLAQLSFILMGLVGLGVAYGPLTGLVSLLPVLKASYSIYAILLACFALACLAAFGIHALLERATTPSAAGWVLTIAGWAGLLLLAVLAAIFVVRRAAAEQLLPSLPHSLHGGIGFWALVGAASLLAALGLVAAGWRNGSRFVTAGILGLVLIEAGLFAVPYQPQVPARDVPPPSAVLAWLQDHAAGRPLAPIGLGTLMPETALLYGLSDVRSYDVLQPLGVKEYWSLADPAYYNDGLNVWLFRPRADWLAAAGVAYAINPGSQPL